MPPTPTVQQYMHNRCIVCAAEEDTSKGIGIKDEENLAKLMKFFWEGLSVEVKPLDALKHEFCQQCAIKVIEFYDTNEVLMQLEKHLRSLQKTLILSCTQGIAKLKEDGHPLLPVHKNLFEKWGNGFKSEDEEDADVKDDGKGISTFLEETDQAEGSTGNSSKTPAARNARGGRPQRQAAKKRVPLNESSSDSEPEEFTDEMDD